MRDGWWRSGATACGLWVMFTVGCGNGTLGEGPGPGSGTGGRTGTDVTCGGAFQATTGGLVTAPAQGGACWHGYAFDFTDPYGSTITPETTSAFASCGASCSLTAAGMIVANVSPMWGYAGLGVQLNQSASSAPAEAVTPMGSSLTVSFTHAGSAPLWVLLTDGSQSWCSVVTGPSPVTIPYGAFNTKCYDSPADGTAYAKQPITAIDLNLPGGATATPYDVSLTDLTEN